VLVYNLTPTEVTYKGRRIPPNGGSLEYQDLTFIPTRDLELEKSKVLAFGSVPHWWIVQKAVFQAPSNPIMATVQVAGAVDKTGSIPGQTMAVIAESPVSVTDVAAVSMSSSTKKK
jgi:hypothetical protein